MGAPTAHSLHRLFGQCAEDLLTFARRRVGAQEAPDIVQETFLRLLQYPDTGAIRDPRAFLFQATANLSIDQRRRAAIRARHAEPGVAPDALLDPTPSPERHVEAQQALKRFRELLAELPPVCRHAFVLHRIEGLAHAEVAQRLGISARSSERYVMQAMRHIAGRFDVAGS